MKIKTIPATANHQAVREDFMKVLRKHEHVAPEELLAMACILVGQLIAVQDQRKYSYAAIMALVSKNIEEGNKAAIESILGETKGTA